VRGLRKVLGSALSSFCACYVEEMAIFSKTSEEHLRNINLIFKKLTSAGFTINALKCKFCQPQMNFLGHVIGPEAISADPERIAAILSYPAPRNQKELRQFLGTFYLLFMHLTNSEYMCLVIKSYLELTIRPRRFYKNVR